MSFGMISQSARVNAEALEGDTPLMAACRYWEPQCIRVLLNAGANPEARNLSGRSVISHLFHPNSVSRLFF